MYSQIVLLLVLLYFWCQLIGSQASGFVFFAAAAADTANSNLIFSSLGEDDDALEIDCSESQPTWHFGAVDRKPED